MEAAGSHETPINNDEARVPQQGTKSLPRMPAARLVCLVGHAIGRAYRLGLAPVIVGRAADVDVFIPAQDVSRRHARLCWRDGGFMVENLNPRNVTAVNGVPIVGVHPLRLGDRLQVAASAIFVVAPSDDLEQQAARLQKLEVVAQLAAGLTHDFRNALGTIGCNLDFIADSLKHQPVSREILEALGDIRRATNASLGLTQQLLLLSHRKDPAQGVTTLAVVVDDVIGMLRRSLPPGTQTCVEVPRHLRATGNPGELHQALLNLCINAGQAMPNGGTLTVRAKELELARMDALALHLPSEGRYVEVSVADTGDGMDEETLRRIFEPFFTTKPHGTGLGLATTYGIVRSAGGTIQVTSVLEAGTTFRLLLPSATNRPAA